VTTESGQATGQSSSSSSGQQSSQASGAPGGGSASQSQQLTQTSSQRPSYVPDKFWNAEKGEVLAEQFTQHFNDLSTRDAERVAREAAIPASFDKYEIKLPDGFKAPEGMQFEFNVNDPGLIEARKAAHELKLDQAGFSRMLGIYAANKLGEVQASNVARDAEMAKLGATGPQRLEAIETWLKAKVGDKAGVMIATMKKYPVAANVEAMESIIRAFSSQGAGGFSQSGRETQEDQGKIPGYENMNFAQRRAAQMNAQFNKTGGGR
jgi:hypothetical protein